MKTQRDVTNKLEGLRRENKIALDPAAQKMLILLLTFLAEFIYKWFLTPDGERKSFFKALLVAFNAAFWKDLFGLKEYLDKTLDKL